MSRRSLRDYDFAFDAVPSPPQADGFPHVEVCVTVPPPRRKGGATLGPEPAAELEGQLAQTVREHLRGLAGVALKGAGLKGAARQAGPPAPHLSHLDEATNVHFTIHGASLPEDSKETRRLWGALSGHVRQAFAGAGLEARGFADGPGPCACMWVGGAPGSGWSLQQVIDAMTHSSPGSSGVYVFAVYFPEDVLRMELAAGLSLPPDRTELILSSDVWWAKALQGFTFCRGPSFSVTHPGSNPLLYVQLTLTQARCLEGGDADTIIFRKPKWFSGWWFDMYHWGEPRQFWSVHGGRRVVYRWIKD